MYLDRVKALFRRHPETMIIWAHTGVGGVGGLSGITLPRWRCFWRLAESGFCPNNGDFWADSAHLHLPATGSLDAKQATSRSPLRASQ